MTARCNAFLGSALAVLTACSDGLVPPAAPSFDIGAIFTATEFEGVTDERLVEALSIDARRSATGGRASGHADISRQVGTAAIAERYSFIALSTEPSPSQQFAAKGEVNATTIATLPTRVVHRTLHADINCLRIVGNTAIASGPLERFVVDGQPVAFPPGLQLVFRVQDNGEGQTAGPDQASRIALTLTQRAACEFFPLTTDPSDHGNIQVRQR